PPASAGEPAAELPGVAAAPPEAATRLPSTSARLPGFAAAPPGAAAELPSTATELPGTAAQLPAFAAQLPAGAAAPVSFAPRQPRRGRLRGESAARQVPAARHIASLLGLRDGDAVVARTFTLFYDDEPVLTSTSYLPPALAAPDSDTAMPNVEVGQLAL